ncbi:MAG: histidine kinase dimerization/phospho-acceptor domain-containing protein, partial [candidate division WOR-3 bacterium]
MERLLDLVQQILQVAGSGASRQEFAQVVLNSFLDLSGAEEAELRVSERIRSYRGIQRSGRKLYYEQAPVSAGTHGLLVAPHDSPAVNRLCMKLAETRPAHSLFLCHSDLIVPISTPAGEPTAEPETNRQRDGQDSFLVAAFSCAQEGYGLLVLRYRNALFPKPAEARLLEGAAQILGVAIANRLVQAALRERVKELTCLYGVAKLTEQPDANLDDLLNGIVRLLPPAWLYSDIAAAAITVDGKRYQSEGFAPSRYSQTAPITTEAALRGSVEVVYLTDQDLPKLDEGPFLKEERSLIDAVARELGLLISRREATEEKARLELQLRHADRLATIGQLAAGVAHELNEPLASILGFAQLAGKTPGLPEQTLRDIDRIIKASLHAREVVGKLMLFARQRPPSKEQVDVNQLLEDGLFLLAARCAKSGIEVVREFAPDV